MISEEIADHIVTSFLNLPHFLFLHLCGDDKQLRAFNIQTKETASNLFQHPFIKENFMVHVLTQQTRCLDAGLNNWLI